MYTDFFKPLEYKFFFLNSKNFLNIEKAPYRRVAQKRVQFGPGGANHTFFDSPCIYLFFKLAWKAIIGKSRPKIESTECNLYLGSLSRNKIVQYFFLALVYLVHYTTRSPFSLTIILPDFFKIFTISLISLPHFTTE